MFSKISTIQSTRIYSEHLKKLSKILEEADAIVIGAGAGLSTSAGFVYDGERFQQYFSDFEQRYGFHDMYSGGFYPYATPEEYWSYWSRYIYINRYMDAPKPVYDQLFQLVKNKDYFVITTNVDHCFQKVGFDKKRLFYTQGDYGLWQCSVPCHHETYENKTSVREMVEAQGFVISEGGELTVSEGKTLRMEIPHRLVPCCPRCGKPLTMNLRADNRFVEDEGWHLAAERYETFLRTRHGQKLLFLELGVGYNTPGIIKYPFWQMTAENPKATYACINQREAFCPQEISRQSICIDGDVGSVFLKSRLATS
ncbi:MAG: Sir2 silent information regulator family NAD-dependent deacetylase [Eubacteriales bacterium]|nr:Sir2 silent information regulator family NAD-dependent deacetylase [Eubacteriales bacterium]